MRVAIAVLTHKGHHPLFSPCFSKLLIHVAVHGSSYGVDKYDLAHGHGISYPNVARQEVFTAAKQQGNTHLLMLDDDQTFPPDLLKTLISRNVRAIGANYVEKTVDYRPVAINFDFQRIDSRNKTGIEKVGHIPFGLFLLDLSVLDVVHPPHFEILWDYEKGGYVGQDIYCCRKFREHGIDIYVDHDASQNVGHAGETVFSLNSYPKNAVPAPWI